MLIFSINMKNYSAYPIAGLLASRLGRSVFFFFIRHLDENYDNSIICYINLRLFKTLYKWSKKEQTACSMTFQQPAIPCRKRRMVQTSIDLRKGEVSAVSTASKMSFSYTKTNWSWTRDREMGRRMKNGIQWWGKSEKRDGKARQWSADSGENGQRWKWTRDAPPKWHTKAFLAEGSTPSCWSEKLLEARWNGYSKCAKQLVLYLFLQRSFQKLVNSNYNSDNFLVYK